MHPPSRTRSDTTSRSTSASSRCHGRRTSPGRGVSGRLIRSTLSASWVVPTRRDECRPSRSTRPCGTDSGWTCSLSPEGRSGFASTQSPKGFFESSKRQRGLIRIGTPIWLRGPCWGPGRWLGEGVGSRGSRALEMVLPKPPVGPAPLCSPWMSRRRLDLWRGTSTGTPFWILPSAGSSVWKVVSLWAPSWKRRT